ncbi:MAG: flagellar biosynthesis protein FlhF [Colwellia sp.]|nr:flagellar biosynthesis protein FlhF [Colwellia sp.]
MKIRRFVAKDMRTALTQIKEELGVDAVIMSNKKIAEGVELMAAIDYSQAVPTAQPNINDKATVSNNGEQQMANDVVSLGKPSKQALANMVSETDDASTPVQVPADSLTELLNRKVQKNTDVKDNNVVSNKDTIEQQFKRFTEKLQDTKEQDLKVSPSQLIDDDGFTLPTSDNALSEESAKASVANVDLVSMQKEMASIRQLLEHQVSGLMWQDLAQRDPQRAVLVNRLMSLGLTEQLSDQIAGYVPAQNQEEQAWQLAKQLIAQQLNTTNNDIINRGGVVALVGPTGVGKTTTIAKLAARFSQLHGADQVALISTDTFRIAGFEQLNTYGKIIGCNVKLAKDAQELDDLLQLFSNKKLILIDTAGMGQRDMRLAEHLTTLVTNTRVKIRNYLVLAANTQQRVMQENVDRFKKIPLSGSIYTKLDESVSIGEIISTSIQNGLPIGYLTDGQRVPEDIKVANVEKLVTLADKLAIKVPPQHNVTMRTNPVTHAEVM